MSKSPASEQVDARKKRAEARARRNDASAESPPAVDIDSEAMKRREELAAELLSYYEFLTTMYLPEDCLKRPPKGGWPSVTAERLAFLGKTDAVIDLLKHIPYISQDVEDDYQIQEKSICNDYTGKRVEKAIRLKDRHVVEPLEDFMKEDVWDRFKEPQHIVALARSASGDAGLYVFYDTRDGQVAQIEFINGDCVTEEGPRKAFVDVQNDFRELDLLPIRPINVELRTNCSYGEDKAELFKQVFVKHGWPTARYRKEACMAEVSTLRKSFRGQ